VIKWRKTPLNEITRNDILRRSKNESESSRRRYAKLKFYTSKDIQIDFSELYSYDSFVARMRVGDYTVIIAFEGAFQNFAQDTASIRKNQRNGWLKKINDTELKKLLTNSISKSLDNEDLQVACSCPDFQYRFDYYLSRPDVDAKYGVKQNVEPEVRNVANNQGYVCKHLLAALYGKRWAIAAAKVWLNYIKHNIELTEEIIWDLR
jgi:hypothetical protein